MKPLNPYQEVNDTMTDQKATNVTWHDGEVSREDRYQTLGQRGATIWFTGLSGSGKSTIAVAVEKELLRLGKVSYLSLIHI